MPSDDMPKSGVLVEDMPTSARFPVKAYSRKPRIGAAIGGTVGGLAGLVGGPLGSVAGAGVGGVAGEAIQQGLENAPLGVSGPLGAAISGLMAGSDPGQIGLQGAEQAALGAAGGVLGQGVKLAGRPLMQAALRATPEVAQTAIKAGVTATKEGAKKILDRIGQAGQVALGITRQATAQGIKYDQLAIAKSIFSEMAAPMRGLPGDAARRQHLKRLSLQFLGENARQPMTPVQLHLAKQRADDLADPLYKVLKAGGKLTNREDLALTWYKKFADQARELLSPIPGYADVNAVTSNLIGVKDALAKPARVGISFAQRALERGTIPTIGGAVGGAVGASRGETTEERALYGGLGAGLGAGLATPQALSWLALQTQNPAVAQIIANLFRGGRLATQPTE